MKNREEGEFLLKSQIEMYGSSFSSQERAEEKAKIGSNVFEYLTGERSDLVDENYQQEFDPGMSIDVDIGILSTRYNNIFLILLCQYQKDIVIYRRKI